MRQAMQSRKHVGMVLMMVAQHGSYHRHEDCDIVVESCVFGLALKCSRLVYDVILCCVCFSFGCLSHIHIYICMSSQHISCLRI